MKKNNFKTKKTLHTRGFTIIETLVAISILLISTTGPLSFAQSGLKASFQARDQVTAFYLAQDAIETIKNIIDDTHLDVVINGTNISWLDGLPTHCQPRNTGDPEICNIETWGDVKSVPCGQGSGNSCNDPLDYNSNSHQFVLGGGGNNNLTQSKYTRTIYVTEIEKNQEAQITVEIKWDSSFEAGKRIIVQENIYKKY